MEKLRDSRKPGWAWFDRALVQRDGARLGPTVIAVYMVIASYAGAEQTAWPSLKTIGAHIGVSADTARRAVQSLERAGWLLVERRGTSGRTSIYHLVAAPAAPAQPIAPAQVEGSTGATLPLAPMQPERESVNENKEREPYAPASAGAVAAPSQDATPEPPVKEAAPAPVNTRPRDLLFDAVAEVLFGIPAGASPNGSAPRIGRVRAALKKEGATPDDVRAFGRWYDSTHPGANRPRDPGKVAEHWAAWKAVRAADTGASRYQVLS